MPLDRHRRRDVRGRARAGACRPRRTGRGVRDLADGLPAYDGPRGRGRRDSGGRSPHRTAARGADPRRVRGQPHLPGAVRGHGNAVVGLRNPIAVPSTSSAPTKAAPGRPSTSTRSTRGHPAPSTAAWSRSSSTRCSARPRPPAAGRDDRHPDAALRAGHPARRRSAEAWIDRVEGVKTIVKGEMRDARRRATVRAEGVFILPRWAREAMDENDQRPPRFE